MKTFFKFILFMGMVWLTQSCSTVHKTTTSTKKTEDSVATLTKDTTSVAKAISEKDNLSAKGVDITLNYGPDTIVTDTSKPALLKPIPVGEDNDEDQQFKQIIQDAVSNYSTPGHIVSSVTIHIDSVTDSSQKIFISDSSNIKEKSTVDVKTNTDTKDKVVSKSGLSFGTYAIIGLVVIILLAVFVIKKFIL